LTLAKNCFRNGISFPGQFWKAISQDRSSSKQAA